MKPTLLLLTCADVNEATIITDTLLNFRLVACVKWQIIDSYFLYEGGKQSAKEVLLIMETVEENYEVIYEHVKKLHSYDTFVLQSISIQRTSGPVLQWLKESLNI